MLSLQDPRQMDNGYCLWDSHNTILVAIWYFVMLLNSICLSCFKWDWQLFHAVSVVLREILHGYMTTHRIQKHQCKDAEWRGTQGWCQGVEELRRFWGWNTLALHDHYIMESNESCQTFSNSSSFQGEPLNPGSHGQRHEANLLHVLE